MWCNFGQVHFLCKLNSTWNLITLLSIAKSFKGVNYTLTNVTWTNIFQNLSEISKDLEFQQFFPIYLRVIGPLAPDATSTKLQTRFSPVSTRLHQKSRYYLEPARRTLSKSFRFISVAFNPLESCRRTWLSKVRRKTAKNGGEL